MASEIFDEKGFEKASIDEIAKKAGLGVGTVYNYFSSKGVIFAEVFEKKFDVHSKYDFDINQYNEKEVADIIIDYISIFNKKIQLVPKWLLKELLRIAIGNKKNENLLLRFVKTDYKFIDRVEEILLLVKKENKLGKSFDVRNMAEIIYSTYVFEFLTYIYSEESTFDKMNENIKRKIYILFENSVRKEV